MNKCKNKNSTIKNNHIYPLILFIYYCSANFKVILFFFQTSTTKKTFTKMAPSILRPMLRTSS